MINRGFVVENGLFLIKLVIRLLGWTGAIALLTIGYTIVLERCLEVVKEASQIRPLLIILTAGYIYIVYIGIKLFYHHTTPTPKGE